MSTDPVTHKSLAIEANNSTWEILGKPLEEISPDDAEEMTRRAYTAAYHWQRAEGTGPANEARASWLLSRVWSVRGHGEIALAHAQRCLTTCEEAGLADFDLAYAHEAIARAWACLGDRDRALHHRSLANQVPIADSEDRELVQADLASEPWFGLGG